MNDRIVKLRELADRFEQGMADDQEMIDAFASMPYDLIEKVEAALQGGGIQGLPFLPRSLNPGSQEFHASMDRLKAIHEQGDAANLFEFVRAHREMMRLAPPWWKAEIDKMFDELFGLSPDAYTEDGQPMYSAQNIAANLGVSKAELIAQIDELSINGFQTASSARCFRVQ